MASAEEKSSDLSVGAAEFITLVLSTALSAAGSFNTSLTVAGGVRSPKSRTAARTAALPQIIKVRLVHSRNHEIIIRPANNKAQTNNKKLC
jgi:hypothetical protein